MKTVIPIVTIIVALMGLVGTSFWYQKDQLGKLKKEVTDSNAELNEQIAAQGEKIILREASIRAMSEDLEKKGQSLTSLEKTVQTDREASIKRMQDLAERWDKQRTTVDEIKRKNNELEAKIKKVSEASLMIKETVQQQMDTMQKSYTETQKQMLLLKESVLMGKQQPSDVPNSTNNETSPVAISAYPQ